MSTHLPKAPERPPAPPGHFDPPQRTYAPANRPRLVFDCYACGGQRWWRRPGGGLVCASCHPPAPGTPILRPRRRA